MAVSVNEKDWEAIVVAILTGQLDGISTILDKVDKNNGLIRYYLYVKWLDLTAPKVVNGQTVVDWPPERTASFISYSPFTRNYVEEFVKGQTTHYAYIQCTDDPAGKAGWKEIDEFFG